MADVAAIVFVIYEFIYVSNDGIIIIQWLLLVSTPRISWKLNKDTEQPRYSLFSNNNKIYSYPQPIQYLAILNEFNSFNRGHVASGHNTAKTLN